MTEQLSLIPDKLITPKARKVVLTDLPEDLIGPEPEPAFIDSIRKFGFLQPIVLLEHDNIYQVACGRRRIRAARALGLISIPAQIYPLGWTPASVLTLIENTHRKDNLPAQLDAIATLRLSATPEEICTAVGITHQELNQAVKMLDALVPELRDAMKEGRIKTTTAKQASKLPVEQQRKLAERDTIKSKDVAAYLQEQPIETTAPLPNVLEAEAATQTIEVRAEEVNTKVSKQSWKLQAKPLIEKLLAIVPEGEDTRQYLELVADALKAKA
jgi:ParB/RepB/Spo0J family partition protein